MKNKLVYLLLLILGIFIFFSGCKTGSKVGGTITFWAMPNAPDDVHKSWMEQKIAQFEAETGVKVKFEQVGWGDAWTRISAALTTGVGADVFQVGTTWNPQFAATSGLEEINIDEFGGKAAYLKANLDSTSYKGKNYGLPWFAETRVLFYNKKIFDKVGVVPPQTYDELVEVGKKIIAKNGEGSAISLAGTNAWDLIHNWAIVLWAYGGHLVSSDNTKATFNSPEGITAMKWYVDLVRNKLASKACAEYNQPQADAAFINESVAMCFMSAYTISNIKKDNPSLNYGVVEPPAGPNGRHAFSGGSNLVILKASKNKAAAKAWIKFLLRNENLIDYSKGLTNMLPSTIDSYNDPYYKEGNLLVFKKTLDYATAYPALGVWGDIENGIVENFKNILSDYVNGKYDDNTVKKYLDAAADRVNTALSKEK